MIIDSGYVQSQFFIMLFCRSWIALASFLRERARMVFFPFLKFFIAHSARLALRERSLVEIFFVSVRICSRYFGSTTLSYSRQISSSESRTSASVIMDKSGPPVQRLDASFDVMKFTRNNMPAHQQTYGCARTPTATGSALALERAWYRATEKAHDRATVTSLCILPSF